MQASISYLMPLLTFFLGAALTLVLKRSDNERSTVNIYAKELSDAANEWYNQIHELYIAAGSGKKISSIITKCGFYGRNRIVLPKYLRALEVLKQHKRAAEMVVEAEKILGILTTVYITQNNRETKMCRFLKAGYREGEGVEFIFMPALGPEADFFNMDSGRNVSEYGVRLEDVMPALDMHIQTINIEAGRLIR